MTKNLKEKVIDYKTREGFGPALFRHFVVFWPCIIAFAPYLIFEPSMALLSIIMLPIMIPFGILMDINPSGLVDYTPSSFFHVIPFSFYQNIENFIGALNHTKTQYAYVLYSHASTAHWVCVTFAHYYILATFVFSAFKKEKLLTILSFMWLYYISMQINNTNFLQTLWNAGF